MGHKVLSPLFLNIGSTHFSQIRWFSKQREIGLSIVSKQIGQGCFFLNSLSSRGFSNLFSKRDKVSFSRFPYISTLFSFQSCSTEPISKLNSSDLVHFEMWFFIVFLSFLHPQNGQATFGRISPRENFLNFFLNLEAKFLEIIGCPSFLPI